MHCDMFSKKKKILNIFLFYSEVKSNSTIVGWHQGSFLYSRTKPFRWKEAVIEWGTAGLCIKAKCIFWSCNSVYLFVRLWKSRWLPVGLWPQWDLLTLQSSEHLLPGHGARWTQASIWSNGWGGPWHCPSARTQGYYWSWPVQLGVSTTHYSFD